MQTEIKESVRLIKKEIQDHIDTLNEKDDEGEEMLWSYRNEIDTNDDRQDESISELVASADFDSTEFNIGFEQGYLRGLEVALSVIKK